MESLNAPFPVIYEKDVRRWGIPLKRFVFHPDAFSQKRSDAAVFSQVGREDGREAGRAGGREDGREDGREGGREGGRTGGRTGGKEGGRTGEREEGQERR